MKQLSFEFFKTFATESGGSLFNGKRKTKRVLAIKTPIHLVLRSDKAKGILNFTRHEGTLVAIIQKISAQHGVRVYSLRPYTRLLTWGRQFRVVLDYLILNQMEVFGLRPSKSRPSRQLAKHGKLKGAAAT